MRQNRIRELRDKLTQLTANEDRWHKRLKSLNDEIWRDKAMAKGLSTDEKIKNLKAQLVRKREEVGKAQKAAEEATNKVKTLQSDILNLQAKYVNMLIEEEGIDIIDLPSDELKTALKMVSETAPDKSDSTKDETSDSAYNNADNQVNTDNHSGENSPAPENTSDDEDSGYSSEGTAFYV